MKKLIFVFAALFILVLISGCNARNNNTVRFDDNSTADVTSDEVSGQTDEVVATDDSSDETPVTTTTKDEVKKPSGKLEVTSFDGAFLKTNVSYNVIRGSAPTNAYKITINDYTLQKFYHGQAEWSYIAAQKFGTLTDGWNNYVLKAFDKDGKMISSLIFSIDFDAPSLPEELPGVGTNQWLVLLFALILSSSYAVFRKMRWL